MAAALPTNLLYFGDNLSWLRQHGKFPDESVDLVYLDPPFNSNRNYNVLFKENDVRESEAQIHAFEDTWSWDREGRVDEVYADFWMTAPENPKKILKALVESLGKNDVTAYLTMMAPRLVELHRVLKPTGSLYLHCDPTASHYLKILLDAVFGPSRFLNETVWKRTSAHSSAKRYGPVHDVILVYSKSNVYIWNPSFQQYDDFYLDQFYTHRDSNGRRWRRSDLTGAGTRNGETGLPWRGIEVTSKGRHWAYVPRELDLMDAAGKIHWPAKAGGMPMLKRYLDEQPGVPLQDVWG